MTVAGKNIREKLKWIIFVAVIVYNSGFLPMVSENSISVYLYWLFGMLGIVTVFNLHGKLPVRSGGLLLLTVLFVTISGLINGERVQSIITTSCIFLSAFYISQKVEWQKFADSFVITMRWLTIISLVLFYYIQMNNGFVRIFPQILLKKTYYSNLGLFFIRSDYLVRNQSLFWEPGLFAGFLVIAIIIAELYREKNNLDIIVFVAGIISSNSTTGILLIFPIIVFVILHRAKRIGRTSRLIITLLTIIISAFLLVNMQMVLAALSTVINLPLAKIYNESINYTARLYGPLVNLRIFARHPIFGAGWNNATQLFISDISSNGLVDAQTSTMTFYPAALGIVGLLLDVVVIIGCFTRKELDFPSKVVFLTIVIIVLNSEPYSGLLATTCILFYVTKELDNAGTKVYVEEKIVE